MDTITDELKARWERATPRAEERTNEGRPIFFAVGPQCVIATVAQEPSGIFNIACAGPNGIGVAKQESGFTFREALEDAELTLRDLGWRMTPKGFEHGRKEEVTEGHNGDT
jgi:hypothetical protein